MKGIELKVGTLGIDLMILGKYALDAAPTAVTEQMIDAESIAIFGVKAILFEVHILLENGSFLIIIFTDATAYEEGVDIIYNHALLHTDFVAFGSVAIAIRTLVNDSTYSGASVVENIKINMTKVVNLSIVTTGLWFSTGMWGGTYLISSADYAVVLTRVMASVPNLVDKIFGRL